MDKEELTKEEIQLSIRMKEAKIKSMDADLERDKKIAELDCVSIVQERIRRNIEVCNAVVKTTFHCENKELEGKALKKIEELMDKLEA